MQKHLQVYIIFIIRHCTFFIFGVFYQSFFASDNFRYVNIICLFALYIKISPNFINSNFVSLIFLITIPFLFSTFHALCVVVNSKNKT